MVPILKMRRFSCLLRLSLPPEMGEMAQTFISDIEWLAALKCRATDLSTSLFLTERMCSANLSFFKIYFLFLSDEEPTLETLDYTIRIGSTPTFLYFGEILDTDNFYITQWVTNTPGSSGGLRLDR